MKKVNEIFEGHFNNVFSILQEKNESEFLEKVKVLREDMYKVIDKELLPREKEIIYMRYGLKGQRTYTQMEIAKKLGISRSYVSRIEKKALDILREKVNFTEA